ncbi:MAG TPA: hypothetical protein VJ735_20280 [Actinomycetes bacterium]|nr:hypothetical protein [Actinomycetes bacterium]
MEQRLMELLIGFGLVGGSSIYGLWSARRAAREARAASERHVQQIEPIVQEVTGPDGEPGVREMLKAIGQDAREAKVSADRSADQGLLLHRDLQSLEGRLSSRMDESDRRLTREVGVLTGRVESVEKRIDGVEAVRREVRDIKATVRTVGAMRSSDMKAAEDGTVDAGGAATEAGPTTSAGADRRDSPQPPPRPPILPGDES